MMASTIKWNIGSFEEFRRGPAGDMVYDMAGAIASACGEGFIAVRGSGVRRDRAAVLTATPDAMRQNAQENTILVNMQAGRR